MEPFLVAPRANDLVDRVYEASVVPDEWPEVIRRFVALTGNKEGVILATNGEWFRWVGSSPIAEKIASDHYSFEGGAERSRRLMQLGRPGFVSDYDVFSAKEMVELPLFRDFSYPGWIRTWYRNCYPHAEWRNDNHSC